MKRYEKKFSPVWIPIHEMEIGDTFDSGYTVTRKEKWKKWDVLVVKDPDSNNERYFDINTGYWVGSYERRLTIVLVDTNADIPSTEE